MTTPPNPGAAREPGPAFSVRWASAIREFVLRSSHAVGWVGALERYAYMTKRKRKLTAAERRERVRRRQEFMTIFLNGRQKRVRRPPTVDGMDLDQFIKQSADPIWLHQHGMWELMIEDDAR